MIHTTSTGHDFKQIRWDNTELNIGEITVPKNQMANSQIFSFSPISSTALTVNYRNNNCFLLHNYKKSRRNSQKRASFKIQAAKLPAGVELPKEQPKFNAPFLGFTKTAEIWNSRACMIGLIGTFIVELVSL
ncbi:Hypothetical predicted protein [Olea europaea subsp. europaea]|uniref:Uncharacterized protein n=1 Tax=Olea europaea subsp. europaea TaxID=158383 RepID=A0A8S0T4F9_OLEEU|nr:Hypothetical predicted protein [Olea europaea subsp. europaea]